MSEDRDPTVRLDPRLGVKLDASSGDSLMPGVEVLDAKEEVRPARHLVANGRSLDWSLGDTAQVDRCGCP
jgi:hypothetical protein